MTSGAAADDPLQQLSPQGSPLGADPSAQKKINENNRRSNKPIMEKKRRARINNCLNELKTLILDATKKDPARHSKLEKADILEMTVKHLESMQRHGVSLSASAESAVTNKFKAGFSECTNEVVRFPGLEPNVRKRLVQHLSGYLNDKEVAPKTLRTHPDTSAAMTAATVAASNLQLHLDSGHGAILLGAAAGSARGVQLVPTRLPNGDIALVLPSRPAAETATSPSPPPPPSLLSGAVPTPPLSSSSSSSSSCSASSGIESPTPDRPPSSCYSPGSCDSSADAYGLRSESPLALVTKHRRDDQHQMDLERPWRPW